MNRAALAIVLVFTALSVTLLAWWSRSRELSVGPHDTVTVGMESTAVNSLISIAQDQAFFPANGLNVTVREYPSGLAAVGGLLNAEVDVATAAEFVIVGKALAKQRVRTVASIDKFRHNYILGRRDRGINAIADLKGRRIGVALTTAAEFYLGRFLDLHGMNMQQVTLVNVSPPQSVEALVNGDVDAVIAWQPNVMSIEGRLGDRVVKWPAQSDQEAYCTALVTDSWAAAHPRLINRFLASLVQAETFSATDPEQARAIVQRKLGYDDAYIAAIWPEHQLSLSLDQSLILAMEDEARWMIRNNLTPETSVPNFLDYIAVDGLTATKPAAVNIIR